MSLFYECGRCGELRQGMRLPDEWSPETVAKWQALEERFICDDCEAVVVAWCAEQNIGDAGAHDDATSGEAGQ